MEKNYISHSILLIILLTILLNSCAIGQVQSTKKNHFSPYLSIGVASNFYTRQFQHRNNSPKPINAKDQSGFSYCIGVLRHNNSKHRSVGLLVHSFSSRAAYSYDDTFRNVDSTYALVTYVKNRRTHWYVGLPITWTVLKKSRSSRFFLGFTCEPMIFLTSYLSEHRENNFEKTVERDFSHNLSTFGLMAACSIGFKILQIKQRSLQVTLNNQIQFFSHLNLSSLHQHRHNIELGLTYVY